MGSSTDSKMIVGLDIGTSKVVAIVGAITQEGVLEIVGIGSHPSRGLKKGVVVNIESTVQSIQRAIEEAELMAGCQIHSVYAGIAGNHIRSLNSHGIVAIRDREVYQLDLERVIDAAQAVAIPADQKVLHILPQEYVIDTQEGIKRELGVCLVDIGGGTTDIAIFTEGAIRHTGVIPIAGDQVTNDIAMALRTPTQNAEEIKIKYACALTQLAGADETIKVPSVGDRPPRDLSRQALAEVVEPRYDELFTLVQAELRRSGFEDMIAAGIVLTGGTSKMEGVVELAEEIFHTPVRIGSPQDVNGLTDIVRNPIYSTGVGLLQYGLKQQSGGEIKGSKAQSSSGAFARIKNWFQNNF